MKKLYNGRSVYYGLLACICVFAGVGILNLSMHDTKIALAELAFAMLLLIYVAVIAFLRRKDIDEYTAMIIEREDSVAHNSLHMLPMPVTVLSIDGMIMWYNELFVQMIGNDSLYNVSISELIEDIKWSEILKSTGEIDIKVGYKDRKYRLTGRIIKNVGDDSSYSVLLYFVDITELEDIKTRYDNEKVVTGLIVVDNYDEIFQKMDDSESQQTSAQINKCIVQWVEEGKGVLKRIERDRYLVLFENQYLNDYISKKFDILERVRQIGEGIRQPISVSIGIGAGSTLAESESFSRAAVDMAQGRGGDQVAIKDTTQFRFFGAKTREYEKSTRVKTRAFARAFKEFITESDGVVFMGHVNADYDCFGAAVGLSRAAKDCMKKAYILHDGSPAVSALVDEINEMPEYKSMLINSEQAAEIITKDTLVVILDTHRPSMIPDASLLEKTDKIVLIDHHRRSTEFLPHVSLLYHEPYASSTCEMATEVLQYIDDHRMLSPFEAKALYVGILMDTKNFMLKTGVRTFEAASYLRRYGLDPVEVKKLFTMEKADYDHKIKIMDKIEIYEENIAIAYTEEKYSNMRVVSSIAADDILGIKNVKAAFVIYPIENDCYISARSLGDINVQLVCEKLGGGGHMTVAGAQLKGLGVDAARLEVKAVISEYLEEIKE